MIRSAAIHIRLSVGDKQRVQTEARVLGVPLGVYVRQLIDLGLQARCARALEPVPRAGRPPRGGVVDEPL